MISWTKLLTGEYQKNDIIRYSSRKDCVPKVVVWNVTSICNFNCRHCYLDALQIRTPDELNQQEGEAFISGLTNLRNFNKYKGKCNVCEYIDICGGCRARAYEATGDYLEEEPECAYQPLNA